MVRGKLNLPTLALLALSLLGYPDSVYGVDKTCSAYMYPGFDDVDIKFAVILGMRGADAGKCELNYIPEAMQQAVAMNWVAGLLNGDNNTESFIPGVHFGIDIYDDCYTEYLAARHAGAIASQIRGISQCEWQDTMTMDQDLIAAVIGTSISQTTTIAANIMKPTNIPMVGISATLPELGDKVKYPGFMRTVPSDLKQAKVIIELAKAFSWSYIVGVQTTDNYGTQGMAEIKKLAQQERICISYVETFLISSDLTEIQMESFVRRTLFDAVDHARGSIGVVYFGRNPPLLQLMEFVQVKKVLWLGADDYLKKIYWVASDAVQTSKGLADIIDGFKSKIIIVSPPDTRIKSFEEYYQGLLENPPAWITGQWKVALADIVRVGYKCPNYNFTKESLRGCNIQTYLNTAVSYLTAAVDSVYLLANSIKAIHSDTCGGRSGMCPSLTSALANGLLTSYHVQDLDYATVDQVYVPNEFTETHRSLKNSSGDFVAVNQSQYALEANINGVFKQIGEFKEKTVALQPLYQSIMENSECKDVCSECLDIDDISYIYSPGSYMILGLFSIHWGSEKQPFQCGVYRQQSVSYIAMSALKNAVHQLNNRTNGDFGYLIVDDCYNSLTVTRMLTKILSGDITVEDLDTGHKFDPSKVAVTVGAQSSPVTMAALPVLQNLNIPMISYSATNPDLDSNITYPYFSRTVNSDSVQADAITLILKEIGVTYVGAIVIANTYGRQLYKLFRAKAESEKICVDDAFEITDKTPVSDVATHLKSYKDRNIQVIVAFAMDVVASNILEAVKQEDTFVFLASEAWGPNQNIIDGQRGERARGSLVLGASTSVTLNYGLREYIQTIKPFSDDSSDWLRDFWQEQFKCDLPGGFNNVYGAFCTPQQTFSEQVLTELVNSPLAVHATLATMSAGFAVRELIQKGKTWPFNPEEMTTAIRNVQLQSSSGTKFRPFLDSGNGNGGFQIYNVQHENNGYVYKPVGTYRSNGGLSLDTSKIKFYDQTGQVVDEVISSCKFKRECSVCADSDTAITTPASNGDSTSPGASGQGNNSDSASYESSIIVLAVICGILVVVIVVIIILAILVCKGKISLGKDGKYADANGVMYSSGSTVIVRRSPVQNAYNSSVGSKSVVSSDERPPLPPARAAGNNQVYDNKAFSDIVTLDNDYPVGQENGMRNRSLSLPVVSDHPITLSTDHPPPPKPHAPRQKPSSPSHTSSSAGSYSGSGSGSGSGSHHSQPAVQILQKPTQEVQPLFYLRDGERYPMSPQDQQMLASSSVHPDYDPQNRQTSPVTFAQEPIIFQNVIGHSMVYTLPSSVVSSPGGVVSNHHNPDYIYVHTAEGLRAVPYATFVSWNNYGFPPGVGPGLPPNGAVQQPQPHVGTARSHDYITPVDVIYGTQGDNIHEYTTLINSPEPQGDVLTSPAGSAQDGSGNASQSTVMEHGFVQPTAGIPSLASGTHTVNSKDYPSVQHSLPVMVPHPGIQGLPLQMQNVSPTHVSFPGQQTFTQHPANVAVPLLQQPVVAQVRPNTLAIVPTFQPSTDLSPKEQISPSAAGDQGRHRPRIKMGSQINSSSSGTPNSPMVGGMQAAFGNPQLTGGNPQLGGQADADSQVSPQLKDSLDNNSNIDMPRRIRTHISPTRLPQPRHSDILEEPSFEVDV